VVVHFWLCFFYLDSLFDSHSVPVIPLCLLLSCTALWTVKQKTANHKAAVRPEGPFMKGSSDLLQIPRLLCKSKFLSFSKRLAIALYSYLEEYIPRSHEVSLKKGKGVPLQAWTGPEGSRKLRLPDFMTTAQDGGKVVSLTHRPLFTPRKYFRYSYLLEGESNPGP